jgi:predicted nucleic acid-binding protein
MELLQCARSKQDHKSIKNFLSEFDFFVLPLTENIGHRALIYVEEYGISCGVRAGYALIAATAIENSLPLTSANKKHFKPIKELSLHTFKP